MSGATFCPWEWAMCCSAGCGCSTRMLRSTGAPTAASFILAGANTSGSLSYLPSWTQCHRQSPPPPAINSSSSSELSRLANSSKEWRPTLQCGQSRCEQKHRTKAIPITPLSCRTLPKCFPRRLPIHCHPVEPFSTL